LKKAPPWTRETAELARAFGLRRAEALSVTVDNLDHEHRALRFSAEEVKSDADQFAYGGAEGWELVKRLAAQARRRGVKHLVTWPGRRHWKAVLRGEKPDGLAWEPLKSIRRSWRTSAKGLKIEGVSVSRPHRFHDVRARFITEVAKVAPSALTQQAARHADPATTARYTGIAAVEVAQAVERAQRANTGRLKGIAGGRK
jgi:integrase